MNGVFHCPFPCKVLLVVAVVCVACGAPPANTSSPSRNPKWAQPTERPGLSNLHVIESGLYRGAQPDADGFAELKRMGVRTIINLRSMRTDDKEIREAGLAPDAFVHVAIPTVAWDVNEEEVVSFLKVAVNPDNRPLFFHCQAGSDRTGTMAAAYRVVVQGWSVEDAIEEMTEGGYGYHAVWVNLIKFVRGMDSEAIRRKAGIFR